MKPGKSKTYEKLVAHSAPNFPRRSDNISRGNRCICPAEIGKHFERKSEHRSLGNQSALPYSRFPITVDAPVCVLCVFVCVCFCLCVFVCMCVCVCAFKLRSIHVHVWNIIFCFLGTSACCRLVWGERSPQIHQSPLAPQHRGSYFTGHAVQLVPQIASPILTPRK